MNELKQYIFSLFNVPAYAEFSGINLLIGSHTFTEIQGVESLARLIGEKFGIETVRIQEPHLESVKE